MGVVTLNVVSIIIGVLLVRIIVVWFNAFKLYSHCKVDYDIDESLKDWEEYKADLVGALMVTAFSGFIIVFILVWYRGTTHDQQE